MKTASGTVTRLMERFGFLFPSNGEADLFFHVADLLDIYFDDLQEGERVFFRPTVSDRGGLKAGGVARSSYEYEEVKEPEVKESEDESSEEETQDVLLSIRETAARMLIKAIAENPKEIDRVEWREMERVLAEAFRGLGFCVELTPPSKDGGKDLILEARLSGQNRTYYVEVKHWRFNRVGKTVISDFLQVIVRDGIAGGLLLSSSGYCDGVAESLTEIERRHLKLGEDAKIIALCRTYQKSAAGILASQDLLQDTLYEGTR